MTWAAHARRDVRCPLACRRAGRRRHGVRQHTRLRVFNVLRGNGFGKLLAGIAVRAARKDAPAFAGRVKAAVEAS